MRFKFDRDNPNAFRCCFCCHVRTGTIFLGIFHLFVQLALLSLFTMFVMHPELTAQKGQTFELFDGPDTLTTNTNLSAGAYDWIPQKKLNSEDKFLGMVITVGSFAITIMLVYGAVKGRPGYLMPFFCLQVFDFCVTCLTGVGYFSYIPNIKRWIEEQKDLPFKEELMEVNTDWLMLLAVLLFVLIIAVKSYLIGVVWGCYRYLTMYERNIACGVVRSSFDGGENPEASEMLLPPKYEDAIRMPVSSSDEPPPPPYSTS